MRMWALSDLHLSLGGDKPMDIFGDHWTNHHLRMAEAWDAAVADDDIVLCPGDLSWAMKPAQAAADFAWLGERPGKKIIIKGNHDYWWPSSKAKLQATLPAHTTALKKNACIVDDIGFYGVRGGDFAPLTRYGDKRSQEDITKALDREEKELQASVAHLRELAAAHPRPLRMSVCLFHYPPFPAGAEKSRFTPLIDAHNPAFCIYGHLHGNEGNTTHFEGTLNHCEYLCASCDLIGFSPKLIADFDTASEASTTEQADELS